MAVGDISVFIFTLPIVGIAAGLIYIFFIQPRRDQELQNETVSNSSSKKFRATFQVAYILFILSMTSFLVPLFFQLKPESVQGLDRMERIYLLLKIGLPLVAIILVTGFCRRRKLLNWIDQNAFYGNAE